MTAATPDTVSPEDATAELLRVLRICCARQPSLALLDGGGEVRVLGVDAGLVRVALGEVVGAVDLAAETFEPDDPDRLHGLLVERLAARHGDTEFRAGRRNVRIDWQDLVVLAEDGTIRAMARPVGEELAVLLTITPALDVSVEPAFEPPPAGPVAEAGLAAALAEAIGSDPAAATAIARLAATRPAGSAERRALVSEVLGTAFVPTGGAA